MLLLVVQSQARPGLELRHSESRAQQATHRFIHMRAIGVHLVQRRARQHVPHSPQRPVANRVVIRIEQIAERWMDRPIARQMFGQQKCLKEPRGMRQMPLRRTGIRHGLQAVVLDRQRCAQSQRSSPNAAKCFTPARPSTRVTAFGLSKPSAISQKVTIGYNSAMPSVKMPEASGSCKSYVNL